MNKLLGTLLAGASIFSASTALAAENWVPHLAGIGEGSEAGALPPAGWYFVNDVDITQTTLYNNANKAQPVTSNIAVDVPIVLWATGAKVLGADYAVGAAIPFDYVSTFGPGSDGSANGTNLGSRGGLFDTVIIPGQLSWKLPNNLFVKAGLSVYLPDGNFEKSNEMAIANSIGFFSLEPTLGISYAPGDWNFSASFFYDHNFENNTTHYTSGDVFGGDYTAMKSIGKWGVGLGGYSQTQIENDTKNGVTQADSKIGKYAIGPVVSYDFGPVIAQFTYNHRLATDNTVQGEEF